jgi:hypothetical protein
LTAACLLLRDQGRVSNRIVGYSIDSRRKARLVVAAGDNAAIEAA